MDRGNGENTFVFRGEPAYRELVQRPYLTTKKQRMGHLRR